jgi:hypothetical protein
MQYDIFLSLSSMLEIEHRVTTITYIKCAQYFMEHTQIIFVLPTKKKLQDISHCVQF